MDILKSNIVVGLGMAVVATVLAPVLIPVVSTVGRPLAKSLIKGGMLFYEKSREAVAVAGEAMEDMMAEIRAEDAGRHAAARAPRPEADAGAGVSPGGADAGLRHNAHGNGHDQAAPVAGADAGVAI
ncbi:MAG TPA: DUF5132 domain-containing protein [Janthinobacterium sp.]|jgi:hypothetical protein|nr:DUF5132 domain-containing protein [Janthinobacterium sp.]